VGGMDAPPITDGPTKTPIMSMKRPIILNKPAEGISHSVNFCSVHSCSLFIQDICEKARDEWLLKKLTSGTKSSSAAKTIASAISSKLGDCWKNVPTRNAKIQLEVKIIDLDVVPTTAEVLKKVSGQNSETITTNVKTAN